MNKYSWHKEIMAKAMKKLRQYLKKYDEIFFWDHFEWFELNHPDAYKKMEKLELETIKVLWGKNDPESQAQFKKAVMEWIDVRIWLADNYTKHLKEQQNLVEHPQVEMGLST